MNYQDTIEYLLENTSLTSSKVFNYKRDAGEEYFQNIFEFYTANLKWNSKFHKNPSYVVFYNKNEIYAEAKKSNNHYIIAFDKGIIYRLERWFGLYFEFANIPGLESFADFEREDYLIGNCEFDESKQIEEFDADTFAGICVATHLFQLIDKWMKGKMNNKNLKDLTSIIIGAVRVYILALPMCKEEFYTEEGSHPHNTIRALNILGVISSHFKVILKDKGYKFSMEDRNIHTSSVSILEKLLTHFGMEDVLNRFQTDVVKNGNEISSYNKILESKMIAYSYSAVKQWNLQNKT